MNPPKILITEDEMLVALDLQQRLRKLGFDVCGIAGSGEEAVERAAAAQPDLVLMDVMLPGGVDGIEAAQRIRAASDVPVIFLTANADDATLERAKGSEAQNYLLKPFRERELQISIELALNNHELKRQLRQARDHLEDRVRERTAELQAANRSLQIAENAATEWKLRYDQIAEFSRQAAYELDVATGVRVWSAGVEHVLGHAPDELSRNRDQWAELIHPDDRGPVLAELSEARDSGSPFSVYYRFQHGSGRYLWIHDRGLFVRDTGCRNVRMLGMMQDVTERKVAEDKIREQAALLDNTQDAIMVRDLDNRVLYWNRSAERLYGWTAAEALNKPIHQLLLKGELGRLPESHEAALKDGEWSGEVRLYHRQGRELIVQSRWTLLRDERNQPRAFLVAHTDITDRKLLEAKFLRAQRLESVGALASGIAHDLNNVFTPILLTAQLLGEGRDETTRANMLDVLQASARRGADMVKQVLTFTRGMESGPGVVQVKHLISELEKMMRDTFPRDVKIQTNIPRDLWPVRGDATLIYQALLNLCVNARDAMPGGGLLKIEARNVEPSQVAGASEPHPPRIVIAVADSGMGMSPEVQRQIFEPFFTTKDPGKGTGLGLSTVMAIVKAHSGSIDLRSAPGVGSAFQIYLPADASPAVEAAAPAGPPPCGDGELLLVVDDESAIRQILKNALEAHDYEVLLAEEGTEALALYAANHGKIAAVIVDMMMPVMDGPATIRALRKLDPSVRLIATSGLMDPERLATIARDENVAMLVKPYPPHKLLTTVQSVLHPAS